MKNQFIVYTYIDQEKTVTLTRQFAESTALNVND